MAKNNKNEELDHDELFDIAIKEHNKDINKKSPTISSQWKTLEEHFISQGIWKEGDESQLFSKGFAIGTIISKIFYWPSSTIDRFAHAIRGFIVLLIGILMGLAPLLMMQHQLTRSGDEDNKKVISDTISFDSVIERSNMNPISYSQKITRVAIKEGLVVEINQSQNNEIILVIKNLKNKKHISLKALLEIPPQSSGNIKLIINEK